VLRAYDVEFRHGRKRRSGQLRRGEGRDDHAFQAPRARHAALQRALELRRTVRLDAHDRSIPANTPDKAARVAQRQAVTPDKNAPLVVYLASDAAKDVNGQVFYTRRNETS